MSDSDQSLKIGIVGLGYVGLPLVLQFAKSGAQVLGIDVDASKVAAINAGESYIKHISGTEVQTASSSNTNLSWNSFDLSDVSITWSLNFFNSFSA